MKILNGDVVKIKLSICVVFDGFVVLYFINFIQEAIRLGKLDE
jgi:hypothetical protein